jgi:hypothetical protein
MVFPLGFLVLDCEEVHGWRATLNLPVSCVQPLEQTLVADERTNMASEEQVFPKADT